MSLIYNTTQGRKYRMMDLNGTFAIGEKQSFIAELAKKIIFAEIKGDTISFNSSIQHLRKKMIENLKERKISCRFSTNEIRTALLKNSIFTGNVSISQAKSGMEMVTAFSDEMRRLVEILMPLASDYRPPVPANEGSRLKVVPIKMAA